ASAKISAKKLPFEQTAKCLSADKVLLTGTLDLNAGLSSEGQLADLVKNLKGTVGADLRNGQVMKFPLLGNILSMKNIVALAEQGGPKLTAEGFPYRQLSAKGHLDGGYFMLDEGVFYSNAVGLGANGWISLTDYQSRLTVLVAPLALLTETIRKLPILGYVIGGTFTSLPVAVSGDIRDPLVVPLGPGAITSELTGILGRTLSLPGHLAPSTPPPRR
ncbi:MAG TPA: AsmA-like C-terminal domain-containing protein, partial [Burkholderiales bacterium]|nr:AsmA-like C-terminal domain-containing protein [Burkholderiales bacterium]